MGKRLFLGIILVCLSVLLIAQTDDIIELNDIPKEGILLNRGWKFKLGDNPEWAKEGYNDNHWKLIDPTQDIHDIPQLWKDSVVWFRLQFYLDENLKQKQMVLLVQQSGASEMYLNGDLVYRFGIFNSDATKAKAYDPLDKPVGFSVKKYGLQLLAIRYILQPDINYKNYFGSHNYALNIKVNSLESSFHNNRQSMYLLNGPALSITGIFFILTILHLSFYWFNRSQKANLYSRRNWKLIYYQNSEHRMKHYFIIIPIFFS